jgi:hypothetical protein
LDESGSNKEYLMKKIEICNARLLHAVLAACCLVTTASAQTRTLRIAAYNIEDDINGATSPLPGLIAPPSNTNSFTSGGVLEGIGEEIVGTGPARPLDILALEETTSNPITVAPIVSGLNSFYGVAGMYSNSTYQATESGGNATSGNGPNAIVYNTRTVQLLASVPVDPPGGTGSLGSGSGEYREIMRYQFAPAGVATNALNTFYIYVSHYKSGSSSSSSVTNSRNGEALIVRSNMVSTLPSGARILHVGDFNTGDASEPMYATLTAPGAGQLLDTLNPARSLTTNFDGSAAPAVLTESATYLQYRDDYQMMTTNVYYGSGGGLALVPGTYHAFGNNGTTPYQGNINSGSDTALNGRLATNGPVFISAAQLYLDLTNASDHLPVVADYTVPLPVPVITGVSLAGANLVLNLANCATGAVCTVLSSTNAALPLAGWTPLATNTAPAAAFTLTATNAVNPAATGQFCLLLEK